jgi:hypothetical protein
VPFESGADYPMIRRRLQPLYWHIHMTAGYLAPEKRLKPSFIRLSSEQDNPYRPQLFYYSKIIIPRWCSRDRLMQYQLPPVMQSVPKVCQPYI